MRTSNFAMRAFDRPAYGDGTMTISGAINKTAVCFLILIATASLVWGKAYSTGVPPMGLMWLGVIGGLIAALVTAFKPTAAPISAPVYAGLEGLAIGGISAFYEARFPGIVIQAVTLTFATLGMMLFLYRTGIIKVTEKLRMGIFAATGAVCIVYLISMVVTLFGGNSILHSNSTVGIIISLVIVGIAALNLVLDFDLVEQGSRQGMPKYMEWYAAFALMVTLVWLYLEILRLLSKLQSRR